MPLSVRACTIRLLTGPGFGRAIVSPARGCARATSADQQRPSEAHLLFERFGCLLVRGLRGFQTGYSRSRYLSRMDVVRDTAAVSAFAAHAGTAISSGFIVPVGGSAERTLRLFVEMSRELVLHSVTRNEDSCPQR